MFVFFLNPGREQYNDSRSFIDVNEDKTINTCPEVSDEIFHSDDVAH